MGKSLILDPHDVCICGDLRCEHVAMTGASYYTRECFGFRLAPVTEADYDLHVDIGSEL